MKENNKGVIVLLIVIIVILVTFCVLFATGTISLNVNNNDDEVNNYQQNNSIIDDSNEKQTITETEAVSIIKNLYNDDVRYIFNQKVSYCGKVDNENYEYIEKDGFMYRKSTEFKTFKELDEHLKQYVTESLLNSTDYNNSVNNNGKTITSYFEKDGTLYCNGWNAGSNMNLGNYLDNKSEYKISNILENSFDVQIKAVYSGLNDNIPATTLTINVSVIKQNNRWLLNSYKEV